MRLLPLALVLGWISQALSAEPAVSFIQHNGALDIRLGDTTVARYVYADPKVSRPYFVDLRTPAGLQVSRRHPPVEGEDATDHLGLHTGFWLSFGDLNGCDYWRLKARTEHAGFVTEPKTSAGRGEFAVRNRYLTVDGQGCVAEEVCRYVVQTVAGGYRIALDSTFTPGDGELVFGDQEEMGLGMRMTTALVVDSKLGGRILDSAGRINGKEIWGKTAAWCDYAGPLPGAGDNRWAGVTVLTAPQNFRPCWSHARDYGLIAMNPFGRNAFTGGEASRIVIAPGQSLRLQYAIVVHEATTEAEYSPAAAYQDYTKAIDESAAK